jgi:transcription termination/antitermination protein NusA
MSNATQILAAFRELTLNKSISREELHDLIKDGILAALAKRYGPNVQAEIEIDEDTGRIDITVLKEVVAEVEDSAREISLEEAQWDDPEFEVGDILEVPVEFADFGRNAVMAAKQRMLQRVREGERQKIIDEYADRVGELLSGEVQQVERGKLVILLNRSRDADAIIPWKEQNPRERFRQGEAIRAVLKKVEETPKGPRIILSRADPLFVAALFKLEVPEIQQGIVEIRGGGARGGRPHQAGGLLARRVDRPGGRLRGAEGLPRPRRGAGARRRADRHRTLAPGPEVFAKRALAPARVAKVISDSRTG